MLAWDGLLRDEPELGIQKLKQFWRSNTASDPCSATVNVALQVYLHLRESVAIPDYNPNLLPPWGQAQIRVIRTDVINFAEARALAALPGKPRLIIGAVEVQSGQFTVFRGPEIQPVHLLASTALPGLFPAVTVANRGALLRCLSTTGVLSSGFRTSGRV